MDIEKLNKINAENSLDYEKSDSNDSDLDQNE